ncbi:GLPGLI family protein [Larkinella arboricola]|uniref:GLPGLI family protein n=1 Tax=Larkinella arboricola TaxID=643671 RepID=A0A327X371_LARAB|nr:GLPGLI family protein [Larkinella arboricola]RAK00025.1 GLPGLI family protein [Larkinella arboricola]
MKPFQFVVSVLTGLSLVGQTAFAQPQSGRITYEVMQKVDLSQLRIVINGQEIRPGSADAPAVDIPETRSFTQYFIFSGNYGKEEQDRNTGGMVVRQFRQDGGPGGPGGPEGRENRNVNGRPFERTVFLDLAAQKTVEVVTIRKDSVTKQYQTELPLKRETGWQPSGKTKKIAGYTCQKATVPFRNLTYTVWYTTELPFTYSPIPGLTPEKGVVLQIESDNEAYKATKIAEGSVTERDVMPPKDAQVVTSDELNTIRQKAMADMRQKMMNEFQNRN